MNHRAHATVVMGLGSDRRASMYPDFEGGLTWIVKNLPLQSSLF